MKPEDPRLDLIFNQILDLTSGSLDARLAQSQKQDGVDRIIGGLNMVADILQQTVNANEKYRQQIEENRLFRTLINHSEDAIFLINPYTAEILDSNDTASRVLGYKPAELLSLSVFDIEETIDSMDQWNGWIAIIKKKGNMTYEGIHKRSDGSTFPVEIKGVYHEIGHNSYLFTIARNVSDRKQTETQLKQALVSAKEASKAKVEFLANMSHEIKTPLNSIVGFSQILMDLDKTIGLPEKAKNYLNHIKVAGETLSELINNILDLSKMETDRLEVLEESLNLRQLFTGIYHLNKASAVEKKLKYTYHLDPNLPTVIQSDRTKLNLILMNLTRNAIKFTSDGKKVSLHAQKVKDRLVFQVIDEGIGIPKEKHEAIFGTFEQVDGSSTRSFSGTGMGLTVVKKMATALNGEVTLMSQPNQGSTFTVTLPLKSKILSQFKDLDLSKKTHAYLPENTVLIVEDNLMNQDMLRAFFEKFEIRIEFAENGKKGVQKTLDLLIKSRLDLILMDMHMPGMDGLTAIKNIRQYPECSNIPIVLLSANSLKDQLDATQSQEINDYLSKPIDFYKLISILDKYLQALPAKTPVPDVVTTSSKTDNNLGGYSNLAKKQMVEYFVQLSNIPIFMTDQLLEQINQMKQYCEKNDVPMMDTLEKILTTFVNFDEGQFKTLIETTIKELKETP